MSEKYSNFKAFLTAMGGKRLLHIGHKHADCDALGSAYAMSRLLPGDLGFALELKVQAQSVAKWLDLEWVENPDPADYDYTIIYDTIRPDMLGVPMPERYAIFDHHESGGHRFSTLHNELADAAEWGWVKPVELDLLFAGGIVPETRHTHRSGNGCRIGRGYRNRHSRFAAGACICAPLSGSRAAGC